MLYRPELHIFEAVEQDILIEDDISEQKERGGNKEEIKSVIGEEERNDEDNKWQEDRWGQWDDNNAICYHTKPLWQPSV